MTYDKDIFGPLPKKKTAVFHHPLGFELYDALAMDLHAMTYAEQCVAAVRAKSTEAELLDALQELCEIVEDAIAQKSAKDLDSFTLQPARAAIAKATGESE